MALFGKKKDESPEVEVNVAHDATSDAAEESHDRIAFSPEKAKRFFDHADAMHMAGNLEYAMNLWLQGLRMDPASTRGIEGFWLSAAQFVGDPKSKKLGKETLKEFSGKGGLNRWLWYLLQWRVKPLDAGLAIKATVKAHDLGLMPQAIWLANQAVAVVQQSKSPKPDQLVTLMDVFEKAGKFEDAVRIGEAACKLDPTNGPLISRVRNLSATSTMSRGGYDNVGAEGGFRANVKDMDKQRQLESKDRIVRGAEETVRVIADAKADYESRMQDIGAINTYLRVLQQSGAREHEKIAFEVANKAFTETSEFRFREIASQIAIKSAAAKVKKMVELAEAPDADDAVKARAEAGQAKLNEMKLKALEEAVSAYPTERRRKFDLGKLYFEMADYERAIEMFQQCKDDAKVLVPTLEYLARSFFAMDWEDEAIATFRQAIEAHRIDDDELATDLQYGLCLALQARAQQHKDVVDAEEAYKVASTIAIRKIGYKDIRERRTELKAFLAELKA